MAEQVVYNYPKPISSSGDQLKKVTSSDLLQFLRFCVVGSLNAVIDFAVLNILLWLYPTTDIWRVLGYNSLAVLLAATNSFFWNKYWTFEQRLPITRQEVFRFAVLSMSTVLMNDLLMEMLARVFPGLMNSNLFGSNILKLTAIIGTMSVSFLGMRLWVFFQRRRPGSLAQGNSRTPVTSFDAIADRATFKLRAQKAMFSLLIIPTYDERENLPDDPHSENSGQENEASAALTPPELSLPMVPLEKINDPYRTRLRPVMLQRLS